MPPTRLFRSATFRLALCAIPLFVIAGWLMLAFVYVDTVSVMERRVDTGLSAERQRFLEDVALDATDLEGRIAEMILAERGSARLYLLTGASSAMRTANFAPVDASSLPTSGFVTAKVRRAGSPEPIEARLLAVPLPAGRVLVIGRDLSEEEGFRLVIAESLAGGGVIMLLAGTAAGLLGSRTILRRLASVNVTAARILQGDLHERVPIGRGDDEFDELARHINAMLGRIESLMGAMREVTDNIAHELRTPLNRLRGRLELAAMDLAGDPGREEALRRCLDETDSLLSVFESLLTVARIENGLQRNFEEVDLAALAVDLVDYYVPLAEDRRIRIELAAHPPAPVQGDRHLLFQAAANLMDNALKYTPGGGRVVVSVARLGSAGALVIADDGPGIPAECMGKARQRFTRLNPSPQRVGTGLGLSVVEVIAHHHGGALELADNRPGLRATLSVPRTAT